MGKCPECMREYHEHKKKWRYGHFDVEAYSCECGTDFREYKKDGKPSFTLKKQKKGKVWKKKLSPPAEDRECAYIRLHFPSAFFVTDWSDLEFHFIQKHILPSCFQWS